MNSILNATAAFLPSLFGFALGRVKSAARDKKPDRVSRPAMPTCPPRVLSNLPEIDRVDIRAMLKRWED